MASSRDEVPHGAGVLHGHVDFPAELTNVGDAEQAHCQRAEQHLLRGAVWERFVRHITGGELGHDLAGLGTPQTNGGEGRCLVFKAHRAVGWKVLLEPEGIAWSVEGTGNDAVEIGAETHHREVAAEATVHVEHWGVHRLADCNIDVVHGEALQVRHGAWTSDVIDHERGEVDHAHGLFHRDVLSVDDG